MTRDQAVKIVRAFGTTKIEKWWRHNAPQHICDAVLNDGAEDMVDTLMALGLLKCDPPVPPPIDELAGTSGIR